MNTGTATLDFGAAPGSQFAEAVVTGQGGILSGSQIEAYMMADTTADNNDTVHRVAPIRLTCGAIVPGTGFTIFAQCDWNLSNTLTCHWVWA